jgi:SET domain-containing protein
MRKKHRARKIWSLDPRASRFPLRIAPSLIDGHGVFALAAIPWHQRVIEYTGERISTAHALVRWKRILARRGPKRTYFFRLDRHRTIDGAVGGNGAELINHSCSPNLRSKRIRGRLFLFSRKNIRAGEELTYDYGFPRDALKVQCRCGSPRCRGTINRK